MATITQVQTEPLVPQVYPLKTGQVTVEEPSSPPTPELPDIPLPPPSKNPMQILNVDKGTPDGHVPRDPRLIRLTGVHPFNVEPPLTDLFREGMFVLSLSTRPPCKAHRWKRFLDNAGALLRQEPWTSA